MLSTIGVDIAKSVFQLHAVDLETGEIRRLKLRRSDVLPFFANRPPSVVAMEACSSSHHWARQLRSFGHEVRLIATKFVRPFVKNNKTDAHDAQAIWEAAQRPEMRFVPVKSEEQQAILVLHSMREGLVKARTAQLHQLRAAFYEFGIDLPEGRHWVTVRRHTREQGKRAVIDFHHDSLERFLRFFICDFQKLQNDRLVLPEHVAICDAKQKGITDLTGGARNSDTHWGFSHNESPQK